MQRATLMPSIKDIKWHTLFFSVDLPELFISARTPATAMYMNPPAVNPCKVFNHQPNIFKNIYRCITRSKQCNMFYLLPQSTMTVPVHYPRPKPVVAETKTSP